MYLRMPRHVKRVCAVCVYGIVACGVLLAHVGYLPILQKPRYSTKASMTSYDIRSIIKNVLDERDGETGQYAAMWTTKHG
jgi:hypothetical protein